MEEFEFRISDEGDLTGIYKDEFMSLFDALGKVNIERASNVEWENEAGWTVRSHHNSALALRYDEKRAIIVGLPADGPIVFFKERETALAEEVKNFYKLIGKEEIKND